jgi:hypothetical protein
MERWAGGARKDARPAAGNDEIAADRRSGRSGGPENRQKPRQISAKDKGGMLS